MRIFVMQSDSKNPDTEIDVDVVDAEEAIETVETVVLNEVEITDNVGDVSVEINVEELVAKVEAEHDDDAARKKAIRQRLEDIAEEQSFEATYAVEFDKD
jgi:hypothetical protein